MSIQAFSRVPGAAQSKSFTFTCQRDCCHAPRLHRQAGRCAAYDLGASDLLLRPLSAPTNGAICWRNFARATITHTLRRKRIPRRFVSQVAPPADDNQTDRRQVAPRSHV